MKSTNSEQSLVSVIMPTYNHAKFIGKAIDSVLNQTYQNLELIIIDNYSEDNTEEIITSYKDDRIKYLKFRNHGIIAASRNHGIKHSHGEYIAFLDSDDWWYPEKLKVVANYFQKADIIYHNLDIYTSRGKKYFKRIKGRTLTPPPFVDLMINGSALANSAVAIKKSIVDQVEGLSEDRSLIAAEDSDLWLKISKITDNFKYIPKSLGGYWMWEGNATEISEQQISRVKALSDKHIHFLTKEDRSQHEIFLSYTIGRIKQKMGFYDDALELFNVSIKSHNLKLKLKSVCLIMLIYARRITTVQSEIKPWQ